ncbi:DUF4139 domain-containing protein [Pseudogemmobacter humi]|uniref:DUF4139 domain-containing protein n=1 Tax=Pseudogemmobacter humi TaxID=2483812 RepID=A0A3P5WJ71_9RHOB|nr:DUF4139 domain-containing protein [Pseudogemmobacter humi]VDC23753.1 hypothetical protein XINFAN_01167 [Pseudogemmobacter humi]
MRALLAALLTTTALPAFADTILATSRVTAVTVYPEGAKITREVSFTAPSEGTHELLVTDLPASTQAGLMRLSGDEGFAYGAFSLRADRLPPRDEVLSPEQQAAKAAVEAAEQATLAALTTVEAAQARIGAAEAQARFLSSFSGALPENATPGSVKDMAAMIGAETLAAAGEAALARTELRAAQKVLEEAQKTEAEARAALDALPARDSDYTALAVAVEAAAQGEGVLTVTHYVAEAGWRPFYDIHLTRAEEKVAIDRSVLVTQYTGEDWAGVDLTLSSSRPSEQSAPSTLWPELRVIEKEAPAEAYDTDARKIAGAAPAMEAVAAPAPITATAATEGETVVYNYPRKVDVASGVEDLRLALDQIGIGAEVRAVAVPRRDQTAFILAEVTNTSGEPLLPGEALLYREGVLVGSTWLPMTPAGAGAEIAFGALDTIRLTRDMPLRDSGQKGVFTTSNELTETAVLRIENLGAETWPLRVIDQVPYSEQQDLVVKTTASPAPSETDPDGQRGLMVWEFDLAGGEERGISLGYTLSWPEGMVLR